MSSSSASSAPVPDTTSASSFGAQVERLGQRIAADHLACDLQWNFFVAASKSPQFETKLSPYPAQFATPSSTPPIMIIDIDAICRIIATIRVPLRSLKLADQEPDTIRLLHWVLCEHGLNTVQIRTVPVAEHVALMSQVTGSPWCGARAAQQSPAASAPRNFGMQDLLHVFRVECGAGVASQAREERFRRHKETQAAAVAERAKASGAGGNERPAAAVVAYGFHGSNADSFHSISSHGLQQHLCKRSLFGEGIYLSSLVPVSLSFANVARNTMLLATELGSSLSFMTVCEYVCVRKHCRRAQKAKAKSKLSPADEADDYIVITNNDIVRVRYLLVFGVSAASPTQKPATATAPTTANAAAGPAAQRRPAAGAGAGAHQQRPGRLFRFAAKYKGTLVLAGYGLLLLFIGFLNSQMGMFMREQFWANLRLMLSGESSGGNQLEADYLGTTIRE